MGSFSRTIAAVSLILAAPCFGRADTFNYADYVGNTVRYLDTTEVTAATNSDPSVAMFGAPVGVADSLDFSPVSFNSFSSGTGGMATTGSSLSSMIESLPGFVVGSIRFHEGGDFSLIGFNPPAGAGTFASVTADFDVDIVEVDGVAIAPIHLDLSMNLTPSDGDFDLANDGPGPLVNQNWTGDLIVNVTQALIDAGQSFSVGATKVNVGVSNVLSTKSETGTTSFIAKKDFGGTSISVLIPLPPAFGLGLAGLASAAVLALRRQRRPHDRVSE